MNENESKVERWKACLGDWSEDDPDVLAWPWKDKEPVVADVDGQLKQFHSGLLYPWEMDDEELAETIDELGEPSVMSLSKHWDRFDKEMFEWQYDEVTV